MIGEQNMTKMSKPEMAVVRFAESDVIVASSRLMSASVNLTGFSGGVPGDGQVMFNNNTYTLTFRDAVSDFLGVMRNHGISNAGISNGTTTQSFRNTLYAEASQGARNWDGNYNYDPDATWNNGSKDLYGVFIRQ